jgi:hypothetical protein
MMMMMKTISLFNTSQSVSHYQFEKFDGPLVSALGVRSRKLSNVRKGQSSDG